MRASKWDALPEVTCLAGTWCCDEAALTASLPVQPGDGRVLWMSSYSLRGSWVSAGVPAPSAHSLVASISRGQHSSKVLESWTRNSPLRSGKNLRGQPVPPLTQCRIPRRPLTVAAPLSWDRQAAGSLLTCPLQAGGKMLLMWCVVPSSSAPHPHGPGSASRAVFTFCSCVNTSPQIQWLKTTHSYYGTTSMGQGSRPATAGASAQSGCHPAAAPSRAGVLFQARCYWHNFQFLL